MENTSPDTFLTVREVAKKLRITPGTLRVHIRKGDLPATKVGRQFLITEQDLRTYVARSR